MEIFSTDNSREFFGKSERSGTSVNEGENFCHRERYLSNLNVKSGRGRRGGSERIGNEERN